MNMTPGALGGDHLLDDHRQGRFVGRALGWPGRRSTAGPVQRGPAVHHAGQQLWPSPATLVKVAFMPANEVPSLSSPVPEERTATRTLSPEPVVGSEDGRGQLVGDRACPDQVLGGGGRGLQALRGPRGRTRSKRPASSRRAPLRPERVEVVVGLTTNPGGTGSPAAVSSPRLAPLPPTWGESAREISSNQRTVIVDRPLGPPGGGPSPSVRSPGPADKGTRSRARPAPPARGVDGGCAG